MEIVACQAADTPLLAEETDFGNMRHAISDVGGLTSRVHGAEMPNMIKAARVRPRHRKGYVHLRDQEIRAALRAKLKSNHAGEPDTLIIDELSLCQGDVRVDMAVVNGSFAGYEIKSDRDTLIRLPRQRFIYGRCFDEMIIVVGGRHLSAARKAVPPWWGIWEAIGSEDGIEFKQHRSPKRKLNVSPDRIVQLLWRKEALDALSGLGETPRPNTPRDELWAALVSCASLCRLREIVRNALKARGDWRSGPTPFRRGDSLQSCATSQHFQTNRAWLLSHVSQNLQS